MNERTAVFRIMSGNHDIGRFHIPHETRRISLGGAVKAFASPNIRSGASAGRAHPLKKRTGAAFRACGTGTRFPAGEIRSFAKS